MPTLTPKGQWRAKVGDIFQHTQQKELLCLLLEDTPDTPEPVTRVRFITGNQWMTKGFETRVNLVPSHYFPLITEKK